MIKDWYVGPRIIIHGALPCVRLQTPSSILHPVRKFGAETDFQAPQDLGTATLLQSSHTDPPGISCSAMGHLTRSKVIPCPGMVALS